MILEQIKKNILKLASVKTQHEALAAIDFKLSDEKSGLIQMCFSILSDWPIVVMLVLLYLNPLRYQFSLFSFLPMDSKVLVWAFSENFFLGFLILSLANTIFNFRFLWLTVIAWFISNGDIHIFLAIGAVSGVFFSSIRKNLKLSADIHGKIKNTWLYFSIVQMASVILAAIANYNVYFNLKSLGYFSATMSVNRFEFFILAVMIHLFSELVLTSIWGHFYSRRNIEPADWKLYYSTAPVLKKLRLSPQFKTQLLNFIEKKIFEQNSNGLTHAEVLPERLQKLALAENESLQKAKIALT